MAKVDLQPCYVLHAKPYRDTSLLLEVLTHEHGRQSLVARGARSAKSKFQGILQPFNPLLISWSGNSELHTLTHAELHGKSRQLPADNLMIGFYLNEIILHFLHRADPHEVIFQRYEQTIRALSETDNAEPLLRFFERDLLEQSGYGLILDCDVETGEAIAGEKLYAYLPERGPVARSQHDENDLQIHGETLKAFSQEVFANELQLSEAKKMMRYLIAWHMGGKPLRSRELFKQTLKR